MNGPVESYDQSAGGRYAEINLLPVEAARENALRLISVGSGKEFQAQGGLQSTPNTNPHRVEWDLQDYSPLLREVFSKFTEIFEGDYEFHLGLLGNRFANRIIPGVGTFLYIGCDGDAGYEFLAAPGDDKIYSLRTDAPNAQPRYLAQTIYHLISMLGLPAADEDRNWEDFS